MPWIRRLNNFQAEGWSLTDGWPNDAYDAYEVSLIGGEGVDVVEGEDEGARVGIREGVGTGAEGGGDCARILKSSIWYAICANVGLSSGSYFIQLSHISHTESQVFHYHFNILETYCILQGQQFLDPHNPFQGGADNYDLVVLIWSSLHHVSKLKIGRNDSSIQSG